MRNRENTFIFYCYGSESSSPSPNLPSFSEESWIHNISGNPRISRSVSFLLLKYIHFENDCMTLAEEIITAVTIDLVVQYHSSLPLFSVLLNTRRQDMLSKTRRNPNRVISILKTPLSFDAPTDCDFPRDRLKFSVQGKERPFLSPGTSMGAKRSIDGTNADEKTEGRVLNGILDVVLEQFKHNKETEDNICFNPEDEIANSTSMHVTKNPKFRIRVKEEMHLEQLLLL